jgi:hypothetical protein
MIAQHLIIRKSHQDFEGYQETLLDIKKDVEEYSKIEDDYNKLVDEYNELLKEHKAAINKHNSLVDDFIKSKNYLNYLTDINEYLLSIHSFNEDTSEKFEELLQATSEKYGVENIIKKEGKENE